MAARSQRVPRSHCRDQGGHTGGSRRCCCDDPAAHAKDAVQRCVAGSPPRLARGFSDHSGDFGAAA